MLTKKISKNYFNQVFDMLNVGGVIIVDTFLNGKGRDLDKNHNDKITAYMNEFNEYVKITKKYPLISS